MLQASAIRKNRKAATRKTASETGDDGYARDEVQEDLCGAYGHSSSTRIPAPDLPTKCTLIAIELSMWGQVCFTNFVSTIGPEGILETCASFQISNVPHWSASLTQPGEVTVSMPMGLKGGAIVVLRRVCCDVTPYLGIRKVWVLQVTGTLRLPIMPDLSMSWLRRNPPRGAIGHRHRSFSPRTNRKFTYL